MNKFLTLGMTAFVWLALGCAAKKPVQSIASPVEVRYRPENCKPLPGFQPGLECNHVKLIPLTLPAPK